MDTHDIIMLEQFYKPEENSVLFTLFRILCDHAESRAESLGLTYADICKLFNERRGSANRKRSHKA